MAKALPLVVLAALLAPQPGAGDPVVGTSGGKSYTLLDPMSSCPEYLIDTIETEAECFGHAITAVGLASVTTLKLQGLSFLGCVHNTVANLILFNDVAADDANTVVAANYQYICEGVGTTTVTTTETQTFTTSTLTTETYTGSTSTETQTTSTSSTTTSQTTRTSTRTTTTITTTTTTPCTLTPEECEAQRLAELAFVGDDPITYHNNVMKKFTLPDGTPTLLFQTPELRLFGQGHWAGGNQWIDHLVVTGPKGEPVLQVALQDPAAFKGSNVTLAPGSFESLNVTLSYLGNTPLRTMPSYTQDGEYAYRWGSLHIVVTNVPGQKVGNAQQEMVVIEGHSASIGIVSTAPEEETLENTAEQVHLDFVVHVKAGSKSTCEGVLPELWGIRELSDITAAMLDPL